MSHGKDCYCFMVVRGGPLYGGGPARRAITRLAPWSWSCNFLFLQAAVSAEFLALLCLLHVTSFVVGLLAFCVLSKYMMNYGRYRGDMIEVM